MEWIFFIFFTNPTLSIAPEVFKTQAMFTTQATCEASLAEQLELLAERATVHNREDIRYMGLCEPRARDALQSRKRG